MYRQNVPHFWPVFHALRKFHVIKLRCQVMNNTWWLLLGLFADFSSTFLLCFSGNIWKGPEGCKLPDSSESGSNYDALLLKNILPGDMYATNHGYAIRGVENFSVLKILVRSSANSTHIRMFWRYAHCRGNWKHINVVVISILCLPTWHWFWLGYLTTVYQVLFGNKIC